VNKAVPLLVLAGIAGCGQDPLPSQRGRLLDAEGNAALELDIAVAETEYQRQEGLRLYGPLADGEALLLIFPAETTVCINNAGVPFPIDVLYLSADRRVIAAELDIPPNAKGPYCHPKTQLALELNGNALVNPNYSKLELF
jgi:uncharacterized membrane protein (UPF0127 family)